MRIHLIAVGRRMPSWVEEAYREFSKRLPRECTLQLHEIPPGKRGKGEAAGRARHDEGLSMLGAIPARCHVVALDVQGRRWSTEDLASSLQDWMASGRDLSLLVGGPDGLSPECLERADQRWSLSALTFPHALVRVIVAEQLYRAWTVTTGHPYHRS
ncbi:MAG: 23S rRNA (pseudouridine(1915)-N(3))-methyltransferase RlmH [Gammaproteobacteria bacterium]